MIGKEIKEQLPYGAVTDIAKRSGLSRYNITSVLKGNKRSRLYTAVLNATAEYMAEYRAREREALQAVENTLSVN